MLNVFGKGWLWALCLSFALPSAAALASSAPWADEVRPTTNLDCEDLLALPFSVAVSPIDEPLTPMQSEAIKRDIRTAHSFAGRIMSVPSSIIVRSQVRGNIAQFVGGREIHTPFLYGQWKNGVFVGKGRRQSRIVAYHEFGHLVFERNMGTIRQWAEKMARARSDGAVKTSVSMTDAEFNLWRAQIFAGLEEFFADAFAAILSRHPQAHSFAATAHQHPEYVLARNFVNPFEINSWNSKIPHILYGPARAALGRHTRAQVLFVRKPEVLMRLIADAVESELDKLSGEHAPWVHTLTVPDMNRRLVNELHLRLDKF